VLEAMEKQMKAEREKRAEIARSEGQKQSILNKAEGDRGEAIYLSEGEKIKRVNEAEGRALEILKVAEATAEGIRKVAEVLSSPGGKEAANLEIAKQYLTEFGKLAKVNNTMIVPGNLTDMNSMVASAMATFQHVQKGRGTGDEPEAVLRRN
jgi:regulator of protease activity HflC (stomatin/prohibitin superfamily)